MKWLVQREDDIKAHEVTGTFDEVVRFAKSYCRTNEDRCTVFELPRNARVALVGRDGVRWKPSNWFEYEKLDTT